MPSQLEDAGVSSREAEVLRALGQHLTNAEIGAQLYISVRTVESHVSSLLRKLRVDDRRDLARLAAKLVPADEAPDNGDGVAQEPVTDAAVPGALLPTPLTSFVGRAEERSELAETVRNQRLVTAVGPGGVGKTRLAIAVAHDLSGANGETGGAFADGIWYVDLVPVIDPEMIAPAVVRTLGLDETAGQSGMDLLTTALAHRRGLVVLDNCEHLVDGAGAFVEKLLASCEGIHVLATSRTRLLVPFEHVYIVSGLAIEGNDDAVRLFRDRANAAGTPIEGDKELEQVQAICRELDGMALAIELAVARLPSLGLAGLEAGLGDRLRLLSGRSRADDRHSSLRATLDWSYDLASPVDQAVLRRVSVVATPFTVGAAAALAGFDPVPVGGGDGDGAEWEVADALGRLADQSLLVARPEAAGPRYRLLEAVKQYGLAKLREANEVDDVRNRQLHHNSQLATALLEAACEGSPGWRSEFDEIADDLRASLQWVAELEGRQKEAHRLAMALGELAFHRGLSAESQHRFEQAARLAGALGEEGLPATADALRKAAGAAGMRDAGDDALRLYREAAAAGLEAGDRSAAALDLALAATLISRGPGIFRRLPPPVEPSTLIAEAEKLVDGDARAEAAVLIAQAFVSYNDWVDLEEADDVRVREITSEAVDRGRETGDPLLESAALDQLTVVQLASGNIEDAAASTRQRIELLLSVAPAPESSFELHDAYHMAYDTHVGIGDFAAAGRIVKPLKHLPEFREGHLGSIRLVVADALAGNWEHVLDVGRRFKADWERQGRPEISALAKGVDSVALVYGLQGDDAARAEWSSIGHTVRSAMYNAFGRGPRITDRVYGALLDLHRRPGEAADSEWLDANPEDFIRWFEGMWRQWYAALWAEAAVFADSPPAASRLEVARTIAAGNPVASAIVDRADAWRAGDRERLLKVATALGPTGCPYQEARTLVLAGGAEASEGEARLADLGATPMVVPDRESRPGDG